MKDLTSVFCQLSCSQFGFLCGLHYYKIISFSLFFVAVHMLQTEMSDSAPGLANQAGESEVSIQIQANCVGCKGLNLFNQQTLSTLLFSVSILSIVSVAAHSCHTVHYSHQQQKVYFMNQLLNTVDHYQLKSQTFPSGGNCYQTTANRKALIFIRWPETRVQNSNDALCLLDVCFGN